MGTYARPFNRYKVTLSNGRAMFFNAHSAQRALRMAKDRIAKRESTITITGIEKEY